MSFTPVLIAGLIVLPAPGGVSWIWSAMARADERSRSIASCELMHFAI